MLRLQQAKFGGRSTDSQAKCLSLQTAERQICLSTATFCSPPVLGRCCSAIRLQTKPSNAALSRPACRKKEFSCETGTGVWTRPLGRVRLGTETGLVLARPAAQCLYVGQQGLRDCNEPEGEPSEFPQLFGARAIFIRRPAARSEPGRRAGSRSQGLRETARQVLRLGGPKIARGRQHAVNGTRR
jgi:hypothetical protein